MKTRLRQTLLGILMVMTMFFALPVMSQAGSPEAPAVPENLSASQTSNTVTLKWDKAERATAYRIFRKTSKGWVKQGTTTKTSVTVKKLTPATKYTFAVRAYNKCECGIVTWSPKYTSISTATAPAKVSKVVAGSSSVKWSAVKGATGYELYYKLGNRWIKFAETKGTSGKLTMLIGGKKHNLAVRAYIETGSGRVYSDYKTFTATTAMRAPKVTVSSPSGGTIKVKWNTVLGADGYRVYYKLGNGRYKVYKDFTKAGEYTIENLKGGEYTIAVRAMVKDGKTTTLGAFNPVKIKVAAADPTPNCPHD